MRGLYFWGARTWSFRFNRKVDAHVFFILVVEPYNNIFILKNKVMVQKLEKSFPSELSHIVEIESFIDSFATFFDLPSSLYNEIGLSIIEAVNNSILYGNKRDIEKKVTLVAEKNKNQFRVTISDEGEGFDYSADILDPTSPENIDKESTRGLFLMKSLSNEMIFENNGASVTLVFDL